MSKKKVNYSAKFNTKDDKKIVSVAPKLEQKERYVKKSDKPIVNLSRQIESLWTIKDMRSIFIFLMFAIVAIGGVYFLNEQNEVLKNLSGTFLNFID